MRIIIKPLGMVAIALVLGGAFAAVAIKKPGGSTLGGLHFGASNNLVAAEKWKFYTEKGAVGRLDPVQVNVNGGSKAGFALEVAQTGMQPWNIGLSNPIGMAFKAGEKLKFRFWARASAPSKMAIMIQRNVPGFPHCFNQELVLTTEWKEFSYEVTTTEMAKWESMIALHGGFQPGRIELAGLELTHL